MLTDAHIEDRLRQHFAETLAPSDDLVAHVLRLGRRHTRRRVMILAVPAMGAVVAAGGVLAALEAPAHPGPAPFGPHSRGSDVLRLASYDFHLPRGYHLTSAVRPSCRTFVRIAAPGGGSKPSPSVTLAPATTAVAAAATAVSGGCVSMQLTPAFTLSATAPVPYLYQGRTVTNQPVRVGPDTGWVTTQGALATWLQAQGAVPATAPTPFLQLSVEIPQGSGMYRLLEVGSQGMSEATLLRLVGQGLSK